MTLFPAFLKLRNRLVLVVGGGVIAASKIPSLVEAGAQLTVVSPELNPELTQRLHRHEFTWLPKPFEPGDLHGKFLVIAATSIPELNAAVFEAADARQVLCNAVDDIDHCHFYYGSIVQRGDLQIAISTNGKSPALAQRLRKELEEQFGPEYAAWLEHLGATRDRLRSEEVKRSGFALTNPEARKQYLHQLASRESYQQFLRDLPAPQQTPAHPARVFLVGAGPGDPDLLTVKAVRVLQSAQIVLHDSLVSPEILALIPPTVHRVDVGKRAGHRLLTQQEINSLLVDAATKHETVVRLKGGDPLLFGRAAEEIEALRAHNIAFEIVPGISAAFASAAAAQVSLTDRRLASRVLFTTFSRSQDARSYAGVPISPDTTLVVYMPGPDYAEVSRWLLDSGLAPETPALAISKASQQTQSIQETTVAALAIQTPLPAPALLIVGRAAARAANYDAAQSWFEQASVPSHEKISIS
jgi:uroporphyrin-III C-methyltransferase/precorrin-2 dehydrogenase/sirohydrochlorin ferrochelatase